MTPRSLILASAVLLAGCAPDVPSTDAEAPVPEAGASIRTDTFPFEVGGSRLVGKLDTPTDRDATSTIVLVHGYGETNVVAGDGYADPRAHFAALGSNVLVWGKPGRGMGEGEFDIDQPVESSAEEVVAAVHALRDREKDTNVDWRETAELYRETIGENPAAELSVRVFTGANHDLEQSRTGGVREGRTRDAPYAEGYLDAMAAWLVSHGFGSRPAPAEGR